jgi:ribosome modulation factor
MSRKDDRKKEIERLREEGRQAFLAGKHIQTNPYASHHSMDTYQWRIGYREAEFAARDTTAPHEEALEVVQRPEFWCRARLFLALSAAKEKGVLAECLDEMDVDALEVSRIFKHLDAHWRKP